MEVKNGVITEQIVNLRMEWKSFSAKKALDFFQEVIPSNLGFKEKGMVFKEKVTFVDSKIYGKRRMKRRLRLWVV